MYLSLTSIYIAISLNYDPHHYHVGYEERTLFYTSDIAHRDREGDYQIYGRFGDAIRYQGELLNLPVIEGAAVSSLLMV